MNTLDKTEEKGLYALLKGPSGSGKSVAGLSFPGVAVMDFDFKMPAIAIKHFPKKSIDYFQFTDTDEVSDMIKEWGRCPDCGFDRRCYKLGSVCGTSCPFETILNDSITNLESLVISTVGMAKGEEVPSMIKKMMKTKNGSAKCDLMDFDYYKAEMRFTDWYLGILKVLWSRRGNPKNVLFTAHIVTTDQKNIMTGLTTRTRAIVSQGNKVAAWIPTVFDELYMFGWNQIGGMSADDPSSLEYVCITQTEGEDEAKTAYKLPKHINFTNKSFYDEIQKSINGQKFQDSL